MVRTIKVQISGHDYSTLLCLLEEGNVFLRGPLHVIMLTKISPDSDLCELRGPVYPYIKGVMTTLPPGKDNKDSQ